MIKLHGSLNWQWDQRAGTIEPVPGTASHGWTVDRSMQAAIIAPVSFKEEVNFPGTQPRELAGLLRATWQAALDCLQGADQIIIVGVSFATADFHVEGLLRFGAQRRGKLYDRVVYCHVREAPEVLERVQRILPSSSFKQEPGGFDTLVANLDTHIL